MDDVITYQPNRTYIYCLIDPRDESIFYVGQSSNPHSRLESHIESCHNNNRLKRRLHDLLSCNVYPYMLLLCQTDKGKEYAAILEQKVITRFLSVGMSLLNKPIGQKVAIGPMWKKSIARANSKSDIKG